MRTHSLKPFDDGKYLSEEEAMKLLESIPIPKDDSEKNKAEKSLPLETPSSLEIINGNYLEVIKAAVPETIQTSAELQKARAELNNASLHSSIFYTANIPLYGVENGKPFLLFGEREAFLRLYVPNIEEVCKQISGPDKVYTLPNADKARVFDEGISSSALTRFDLDELIETRLDSGYSYFTINIKNCAKLNGAKRELAELIHGRGNNYFDTFEMLADKGISETKVWLLNSSYVSSLAENNLIGRASRLYNFNNNSNFVAGGHVVDFHGSLRGVRRGGAP